MDVAPGMTRVTLVRSRVQERRDLPRLLVPFECWCIDGFSAKLAPSEPYCGWLFASRHGSLDHLPDPLRRRFNLPIADMSVAQGHRRV